MTDKLWSFRAEAGDPQGILPAAARPDADPLRKVFFREQDAAAADLLQEGAFFIRNEKTGLCAAFLQGVVDQGEDVRDPDLFSGGEVKDLTAPVGDPERHRAVFLRGFFPQGQIDLVVEIDDRNMPGADLFQGPGGHLDLPAVIGIGEVDHLQEKVRAAYFVQSGPEGLDEGMREIADKTDGI